MIGSAASLSRPRPQAPLSPFRTPGIGLVRPHPGDAPPRIVSLYKAAGDLPARHILVVEDEAASALEVQQLLRECGYRVVGPAASAEEAQRLIDRGHRPIHCALLGSCIPGVTAIADSLASRAVPVVWIAAGTSDAFAWDRRDEPVVRQPFGRHELVDAIERSTRKVASWRGYATPPPQPIWPRVFPQL